MKRPAAGPAWIAAAVLAALAVWHHAGPSAETAAVADIVVGGVQVTVEVADNEPLRRRGLMGRRSLGPDQGMLFVYPRAQRLAFWMKDTPLDLDIGFFDARGRLLNIETMQAMDQTRRYRSAGPARFALEVESGWFERHRIGPGARLELPPALGRPPAR